MPNTAKIISLGCAKNLCDSQGIGGSLLSSGWRLTDSTRRADAVIINTCSFIKDARDESKRTIADMVSRTKARNTDCQIIVAGCWAQDEPQKLARLFPSVKAFVGTGELPRISDILKTEGKSLIVKGRPGGWLSWEGRKHLHPAGGSAYLRLSEGCSNGCSFCSIPRLRGRFTSRIPSDITREADALNNAGIKEINLIGQDTTMYGDDLPGHKNIVSLLERLVSYDSFKFIRLLYAYPDHVRDSLLHVIAREPNICTYLDIPLQHISTPVLKTMGRKQTETSIRKLIEKIYAYIPNVALRSSFIVGFPGESDADFKQLLRFIEEGYITHGGVFTYSREPHTSAYHMKPQIPEKIKQERKKQLLRAQKRVAKRWNKKRIGKTVELLITHKIDSYGIGRSQWEAPDVDGRIVFSGSMLRNKHVGDTARVLITDCSAYDCYGEIRS